MQRFQNNTMISGKPTLGVRNIDQTAQLTVEDKVLQYNGKWIFGGPWERFGLYNQYVVVRDDLKIARLPAHSGELVPGSTEDLTAAIRNFAPQAGRPFAPMTLELDPTYRCYSKDCGGHCFSAGYRAQSPLAEIPGNVLSDIIQRFAEDGGRIVRFDGGGDPLAHASVRSGELPELASRLGLKSTILTSGDAFQTTNFERIGAADCYLRFSLNAATDHTRQVFHGNRVKISQLFARIEWFADWLADHNPGLPVGATFLLSHINYREVYDCARQAKDSGVNHFSVRRVLGPAYMRPVFSTAQLEELKLLLEKTKSLATDTFRVFVPWRSVDEPDLDPSRADFKTSYCWQSTFKTIIEPAAEGAYRVQLCGRYRGSGVGQEMQLPPLFSSSDGKEWSEQWRQSFTDYRIPRRDLPHTCKSCIDRGFIQMVESLLTFIEWPDHDFEILHLDSM